MSSSSKISSKKTRTYREKVLRPAGYVRRSVYAPFLPETVSLRDFLLGEVIISEEQRAHFLENLNLPSAMVGEENTFKDDVAKTVLPAVMTASRQADICNVKFSNEPGWKIDCYTPLLKALTSLFPHHVVMSAEESWSSLNLAESVSLLPHKPDYTFSLEVEDDGELLSRESFDRHARLVEPYWDESGSIIYPFAVAEVKSMQGAPMEAENQCAVSIIKMLHKLRNIENEGARIPVLCMSLIGEHCTIYLASSTEQSNGRVKYEMQPAWAGLLTKLPDCVQFAAVFYRYLSWVQNVFRPTIVQALEELVR